MTKTQLKEAVKAVVRECLNERVIKEVAPPGDKAERMVQHVKASLKKSHPDWDAEKIASVAIATAWKAHNKGSVEQDECGNMEEGDVQGADSKVSVMDAIVRVILRKVPAYKGNPDKITKLAALLFHKEFGKPADMDAIQAAVERNLGYEDQIADEPVAKSEEDPTKEPEPAEEGGNEEQEEEEGCCEEGGEEQEEEEGIEVPRDKDVDKPDTEYKGFHTDPNYKSNPKKHKKGSSIVDFPNDRPSDEEVDENAQYKHVSDNQIDTAEEDKARTIQTDPEVNESAETLPPNKGQYKTVAPHQYTTTDQNKALTIQTDPKVNEAGLTSEKGIKFSNLAPKKVKENHRVQTRSYVTVKDNPNDPNVMRDPENPQSNGA